MREVLKVVLSTPGLNGRRGLPTVLVGPPGVGKTSALAEVAAMGHRCETVVLSLREPADVGGLQMPDGKGGVSLVPPDWAVRLKHANGGVLFFDELSCAPPSVQAAALRVVFEGVVGDLRLPSEVRMLAAMNPTEQAAGGFELAPPLANRLIHIPWEAEIAEWLSWNSGAGCDGDIGIAEDDADASRPKLTADGGTGQGTPVTAGSTILVQRADGVLVPMPAAVAEAREVSTAPTAVPVEKAPPVRHKPKGLTIPSADWRRTFPVVRGIMGSFINRRRELLCKIPAPGEPDATRGFPTPRSVELAMRAEAGCDCLGASPETRSMLLVGAVGTGFATEYLSFRRNCDIPDPEDLLLGRVSWHPDVRRLDATWATLGAAVSYTVANCKVNPTLKLAVWELLGGLYAAGGIEDLVVLHAIDLAKAHVALSGGNEPARRLLRALQPQLTKLGLVK